MRARRVLLPLAVLIGLMVAAGALVALFAALFDWNSAKDRVARYASNKLQREVSLGGLQIEPGWSTRIRLRDLRVANPEEFGTQPMASVGEIDLTLRLPSLIFGPIEIDALHVTRADAALRRLGDGRINWQFADRTAPVPPGPSVRFHQLRIDESKLTLRDERLDIMFKGTIETRHETRDDARYPTLVIFDGTAHGAPFGGRVETGQVLSLRDPSRAFPVRLKMTAGAAQIEAEGSVADLSNAPIVDAVVEIRGPSLAALYPTLPLALPASPPYHLTGRLHKEGPRYTYQQFSGQIGSSDINGDGEFVLGAPRPRLKATLTSRNLKLSDLGPLVGIEGPASTGNEPGPAPRDATAVNKAADNKATRSGKLLPSAPLNAERFNAIDADVRLKVQRVSVSPKITITDLDAHIGLQGGQLHIDPLDFSFAGGRVAGTLAVDARKNPLAGSVALDLRRLRLNQLATGVEALQDSGGVFGAQVRLRGTGNSIAEMLGTANGEVTLGMQGGRISRLAVEAVSLNGGKLVSTLLGGDHPTPIRCVGVALALKNGVGEFNAFVFDTEPTVIRGSGKVDLAQERFDITLRPEPKKPSLLSARGPVQVFGSFRSFDFKLSEKSWARGVAAGALALVNPLAALLPLIEAGQGEDANCRAVLAPVQGAAQQALSASNKAPSVPPTHPAPQAVNEQRVP